jgi:hypothetical protein
VDRVIPVEQALESLVSSVMVSAGTPGEGASHSFRALKSVLGAHPGTAPVFVDLEPRPGFEAVFKVEGMRVKPGGEFVAAVEGIFGPGCLRYGRAPVPAPPRRAWSGAS